MRVDALDRDKLPNACIGCGKCRAVCPQGIDVPALMKKIPAVFDSLPNLEEVSLQQREAQDKVKAQFQQAE